MNGHRFYLSIIDDFSCYVWLFPLFHKSDVANVFSIFKTQIENQLSRKICAVHSVKTVQTDGGGEFTSRQFKAFLSKWGIKHQLTCPYTPQQNGVVERKHRHIVQMGLCLMTKSNTPFKFWLEAFNTAVYLINRLPMRQLNYLSPYQKLLLRDPDYRFLKVFWVFLFPLYSTV